MIRRWPEAWRHAIMVMIPKAVADKWRLIAMLVTPYRVWARRAGEDVSKWSEKMQRQGHEWIHYGPGKSAEGATYLAALSAEATTGRFDDLTVTMISDLEKGFEKVVHRKLYAAARVYDFPDPC